MKDAIQKVTNAIVERSQKSRAAYLDMLKQTQDKSPARGCLSCSNMAHVVAASPDDEKTPIAQGAGINIGIVTAYNDMLSAHQPLATYPDFIKEKARSLGATAQVAGGVPAMCDGVTQGLPGMELSLFSRDVIAMSTAISLTHNVFDAVACLGVCDKIVPGMIIGALQFGHLPAVFIPAGPMVSGISNAEKARVRQQFAAGEVDELALMDAETASYHSAGTCTFYGTANANQLLMEMLGVQLPSTSFINTGTPLRDALTASSVEQVINMASKKIGLSSVVTEKSMVNALVGLLATGGSTNHTLHLLAIARAAGIIVTWDDFNNLSRAVPLLARVYPNGTADVNHFRDAGGIAFLVHELRRAGMLHQDTVNVMGEGLDAYEREPAPAGEQLSNGSSSEIVWSPAVKTSRNTDVLRSVDEAFDQEGGIRLLKGNLGQAMVKVSAVAEEFHIIKAACRVFSSQHAMLDAFANNELDRDVIVVVRFQGPAANGMPELHKLTPPLAVLQDRGYKVALLTDGRMSGASGKIMAAIHVAPEAMRSGNIGKLCDGDIVCIDAVRGELSVELSEQELASRPVLEAPAETQTLGRNLFDVFRDRVSGAEYGADVLF
ncbi:phosphogluconate dehydratase [Pseudomonadales bacterium]|nr:phosphogluconate dehydratase [Pseudomonadales bacterium]MDA8965615.1 phosphogluconate dehydratase [Pseudomonadales bacterium]